jgi:UDP-4-amino-4,6-dideoxy-N-acetyl-beta-L-altrosamine transaminase
MPDGSRPLPIAAKPARTTNGWTPPEDCSAPFLPYGRQTIEDDDVHAVAAALRADLLTTGPLVEQFERALADTVGAADAVVCSNGTAALHMAVKAAGVQAGEAVIVPSITFLATANCARYEGAEVVFADVDPATGLMTAETFAEALSRAGERRVKAVLPVHLCGHPVDLPAIRAMADKAGALVIEDACHALGTDTPWGQVGACARSAMTCFSFHPVKTICTGEGGAVTTNRPDLAARLRRARNHGATRDAKDFVVSDLAFDEGAANPWWYEQVDLGWNYRLPDVNCALGISQLKKLKRFVARRRTLASRYDALLAPLAPLVRPVEGPAGSEAGLHLYVVRIDFAALRKSRREVMEALRAKGVGTQVHYIPVHRQPYYRALSPELELPGADGWYAQCLSLPLFPAMADGDPARVVETLAEVLRA